MVFSPSGSFVDIFGVMCLAGLCIGFLCFMYRIIYGLFCYNGIKVYNRSESDIKDANTNDNVDVVVSTININPYHTVSCVNIHKDSIIDNDNDLPIATIV
jgi:hypothetical protein